MKSYEILPADMIGSAMKGGGAVKEPKPHEILPEAGVAAQGLGGWPKGASSIARSVPAPEVFDKQAFGLPYDPAGTLPKQGGATVPRAGKVYEILPAGMTGRAQESKPYEIMPGAKTAEQGLGGCGGGCGCGGKCGGGKGHETHPSGMKRSGGCGGKCGGTGAGIVLPPSAGILLPPSWSSDVPSDVSQVSEGYSPRWLADWSPWGAAGWRFDRDLSLTESTAPPLSCAELQQKIDDLVRRINDIATAPELPPGFCGICPQGVDPSICLYPCDHVPPDQRGECTCLRATLGYARSTYEGGFTCGTGTASDAIVQSRRTRKAQDLCRKQLEGARFVSQLVEDLRRLVAEQSRRGCGRNPQVQPDPQYCLHNPNSEFCNFCLWHPNNILCGGWRLPGWLKLQPPPSVRDPAYCTRGLVEFGQRTAMFEQVMLYRTFLISLRENMSREAPYQSSGVCGFAPSCAAMRGLAIALASRLANIPAPDPRATAIVRARTAVQSVVSYFHGNEDCGRLETGDYDKCSPFNNGVVWNNGRHVVVSAIRDIEAAACAAAQYANTELTSVRPSLMNYGCEIPEYVVAPYPCP